MIIQLEMAKQLLELATGAIIGLIRQGEEAELIKQLLETFAQLVHREFEAQKLSACQEDLRAIKKDLEDAERDPEGSDFRVQNAILSSSRLAERLIGMDLVGLGAFMIAGNLHLAALEMWAKRFPKEWANVRERALAYASYAEHGADNILPALRNRFTLCQSFYVGGLGPSWWTSYYSLDGQPRQFNDPPNLGPWIPSPGEPAYVRCPKARDQEIARLSAEAERDQITPIRETAKLWRSLSDKIGAELIT